MADGVRFRTRERALGVAALAVLAAVLVATSVGGVFTVDEDNYRVTVVARRAGRLSVPGTDGLPPTPELLYFDPGLDERGDVATPVVSTAPPLYAPLALPFSYLGWYGLVALNALALVVTAAAAFAIASRHARTRAPPYLAALTVLFGGYSIEYAQGVWPHMLSMALVFGGFFFVVGSEERRDGRAAAALAGVGGLLSGLACWVRYPNAIPAVAILGGILVFSTRRTRSAIAFAGGLAAPLLASYLLNRARLGRPNPINKGGGYLHPGQAYAARWLDALRCAVARVVDFSAQAPLSGHAAKVHAYMRHSAETGAYLIGGSVKKAWLQSMPWVGLALVILVLSYRRRGTEGRSRAFPVRLAGLVVFGMLFAVAISGSSRVDGFCFNQRYLVDLLPFVAIALALAFDELPWEPLALGAGAVAAALLLAITFSHAPYDALRQHSITKTPLVLAVALVAAYALRGRAGTAIASALLAACLAWSLGVHLEDDLPASRRLREHNAVKLAIASAGLNAPAAVFADGGGKAARGPHALARDLVSAGGGAGGAAGAGVGSGAFLRQGRSVYVALPMPDDLIARVAGGHSLGMSKTRPGFLYLFP